MFNPDFGCGWNLCTMEQPQPEEGVFVDVVLIDVSSEFMGHLTSFNPEAHPLDIVQAFHVENPMTVPLASDLVRQTREWIKDPASGGLVTFYSADEADVPETPGGIPSPRPARRRATVPNGGGRIGESGGLPGQQKKPRPTVATLTASLDQVVGSLPAIMNQLESLATRTSAMEVHLEKDLLDERKGEEDTSDLAKAMLAQSQAMAAPVSQLTSGDPIHHLSTSSSSISSKGAQGRHRLQQEPPRRAM